LNERKDIFSNVSRAFFPFSRARFVLRAAEGLDSALHHDEAWGG
jgi:hypothetical protein